jgi:hypothetical protein
MDPPPPARLAATVAETSANGLRPRSALDLARSNRSGARGDLEGEQSPWKERAVSGWQRLLQTTDSSAEQGLEVGHSAKDSAGPRPTRFGERDASRSGSLTASVVERLGRRLRTSSEGRCGPQGKPTPEVVRSLAPPGASASGPDERPCASHLAPLRRRWSLVLGDVGVRFGGSEHHRAKFFVSRLVQSALRSAAPRLPQPPSGDRGTGQGRRFGAGPVSGGMVTTGRQRAP